jgi:hypothetical protein
MTKTITTTMEASLLQELMVMTNLSNSNSNSIQNITSNTMVRATNPETSSRYQKQMILHNKTQRILPSPRQMHLMAKFRHNNIQQTINIIKSITISTIKIITMDSNSHQGLETSNLMDTISNNITLIRKVYRQISNTFRINNYRLKDNQIKSQASEREDGQAIINLL